MRKRNRRARKVGRYPCIVVLFCFIVVVKCLRLVLLVHAPAHPLQLRRTLYLYSEFQGSSCFAPRRIHPFLYSRPSTEPPFLSPLVVSPPSNLLFLDLSIPSSVITLGVSATLEPNYLVHAVANFLLLDYRGATLLFAALASHWGYQPVVLQGRPPPLRAELSRRCSTAVTGATTSASTATCLVPIDRPLPTLTHCFLILFRSLPPALLFLLSTHHQIKSVLAASQYPLSSLFLFLTSPISSIHSSTPPPSSPTCQVSDTQDTLEIPSSTSLPRCILAGPVSSWLFVNLPFQ